MAVNAPPTFEATYQINEKGRVFGEVMVSGQWGNDNELVFESVFTPKGALGYLLSKVNQIHVNAIWRDGRIMPRKWEYYSGTDKVVYVFDPDNFLVTVMNNDKSHVLALSSSRIFDLISMHIQFSLDVAEKHKTLFYDVVSKGKLRRYVFVKKGIETLTTVLGNLKTIRFDGFRKGKLRYHYWLSPEHKNLVVKMQRVKDGDTQYSAEIIDVKIQ